MSTRAAIQEALAHGWLQRNSGMEEYLLYLTRIDKSRNTGTWALVNNINSAKVLAEVHAQRAPVQAWLYYAYGMDADRESEDANLGKIATHVYVLSDLQPRNARNHDKLRGLCVAACEDYRLRVRMGRSLPLELYAKNMKTMYSDTWAGNFSRNWGGQRDNLLDILGQLDKEGVANVSVVVRAINEGLAEEENTSDIKRIRDQGLKKAIINKSLQHD